MAQPSSLLFYPRCFAAAPRGYAAYTAFQRVPPWLNIHFAHYGTALMRPINAILLFIFPRCCATAPAASYCGTA